MTEPLLSEKPQQDSADRSGDNFYQLPYLEKREDRISILHKKFDLSCFEDFKEIPVEQVAKALQLAPSTIKKIQAEALKLAAAQRAQQQNLVPALSTISPEASAPPEARKKSIQASKSDEKEDNKPDIRSIENDTETCLPRAFLVEFWIRKSHEQKENRRLKVFPVNINEKGFWEKNREVIGPPLENIKGEELFTEMVQQLRKENLQWSESEDNHLTEEPPLRVEVNQLQVFQPSDIETPVAAGEGGRPWAKSIDSGKPFTLKAVFALTGPTGVEVMQEKVTYCAQFNARNLATGKSIHLGDGQSDALVENKLSNLAVSPEISLAPGKYSFQVRVMLQDPSSTQGFLEVRPIKLR